ncbi:MAG: helix-turn-helix domain-containing protein [Gemmatimonadetes bacterium]|nr:helix-turn-helix domain-containing protein [Gemmatimonadota bacterium]
MSPAHIGVDVVSRPFINLAKEATGSIYARLFPKWIKENLSMDVRNEVCYRVQQLRRQTGITQEKLAEQAGLSVDGIRKIEGRRATPSLETLYKISKALQIQLVDLMRYEGEIQTEKGRELQELFTYLSTKKLEEIRLAKRITKAVMEELGG